MRDGANILGERDLQAMLEVEREALGREMRQARTVTLADGLVGAVVAIQYHAGRVELLETVLGLRPRPRDLDLRVGPTWPSREDHQPRNYWWGFQRQSTEGVPPPIVPDWGEPVALPVTLTWLPERDRRDQAAAGSIEMEAAELDEEARLRAIIAAARERVYGASGVGATLDEEDEGENQDG